MSSGRPAVFLDRDGVVNEEVNYLHEPEKVVLTPRLPEALAALKGRGFLLLVVTNQSGIGRGYYDVAAMHSVHSRIQELLASATGVQIDGFYWCPHLPSDGCSCRKPRPGMLLRAAADHDVDLASSFTIGDKLTDLEAGKSAGTKTVLVLTGYGWGEWARARDEGLEWLVDFVAKDACQAAKRVLDGTEA
ncbi:MAG: D-glycero-beta-D-manno-heptose 1,7-bisphosphate 7-phosphatase [Promethearchaeota archaeon]